MKNLIFIIFIVAIVIACNHKDNPVSSDTTPPLRITNSGWGESGYWVLKETFTQCLNKFELGGSEALVNSIQTANGIQTLSNGCIVDLENVPVLSK